MRAFAPAVVLVGLCVSTIYSQGLPSPPLPSFEVASIKRTTAPFQERSGIIPTPGRFVAEKVPAATLIGAAYRGEIAEMRGQPAWSTSEFYDVNAPVPVDTPSDRINLMLRSLLIERFQLAAHVEKEERDVMALVRIDPTQVPRGLERVDVDCEALRGAAVAPLKPGDAMPPCRARWDGRVYLFGGLPLSVLSNQLRGVVGRQVIDETGLEGNYKFTLRHARVVAGPADAPDEYPDVYTALREQLGLKLVAKKAVVNILVVDKLERPSEN